MEIDAIDHFAISVWNLQASYDWYYKVFGFEIFHKWTTTWLIQRGAMKIGLFERPQAQPVDDLDKKIAIQHLAFHTSGDGFRQAQALLHDMGIEFEGPEDTGVAYSLFVKDPNGHIMEITTYYVECK